MGQTIKFRTLGIAFVALMLVGVWLVNAIFTQKFTDFAKVTLDTDTIGLQLPAQADVKVRGEIIGEVTDIRVRKGGGAQMTLGLKPGKIGSIPANVSASILPKTLFGEKYVSLVVPAHPSSTALRRGDTITQTKLPIEVEKVLTDIYPLLRTVQPAEINYTLNALATALEGRGNEIGNNLEVLNNYLVKLNPKLPALIDDLKELGKVSDIYADVTPEIAATLRNTITTTTTLQGRQAKLNAFLKDTTAFSDTATTFLDANGDNIVALGKVTEPTLDLLKRYSPEFPCLLEGLVNASPKFAQAFRGNALHINLKTLPKQPRAYKASDRPVFGADTGPYCGKLPNPPYSEDNPFRDVPNFDDGVPEGNNDLKRVATGYDAVQPSISVAGTPQEKALMTSLAAPVMGTSADRVGDVATLLLGPLARGSEVSVQ